MYHFLKVQILRFFLVCKGFFVSSPAGFSSSQTSDCSYLGLLKHLNVTPTNDVLAIMRPVKNWTSTTLVQMDMLLYGILQVVSVFIVVCV